MKMNIEFSKNMWKRLIVLVLFTFHFSLFTLSFAQSDSLVFKGKFMSQEPRMNLVLNLYEDKIDVPGLEGLETCYGYLNGNINGMWVILKVKKLEEKKALVRAACDRGNEAVDLEITLTEDGVAVKQMENCIKCVAGNKYVKMPPTVSLKHIGK